MKNMKISTSIEYTKEELRLIANARFRRMAYDALLKGCLNRRKREGLYRLPGIAYQSGIV